MDGQLPTEFDLIVLGTGLIESAVSASASRVGKRVLHIDSKDYYGGIWASFGLEYIEKLLCKNNEESEKSNGGKVSEDDENIPIGNNLFNIKDVTLTWHVPDKEPIKEEEEAGDNESEKKEDEKDKPIVWTQEKLLAQSRKFNLDLAPKIQFARGDFVELLISSNIARYSEYRSVSRVLTHINNELAPVPCSRSDIFSNSTVSVIEKRMLMKLLTSCLDNDEKEFSDYESKTFKTYLMDKKLSANLVHYILFGIAMCTDDTPCIEGIKNTKRFLNSLGRFGKTPFLYSMYGSGELPQAFCRMSAVFGGIYALNQPLKSIYFGENGDFKGIITGEQKITADHLVSSVECMPAPFIQDLEVTYISRAIFITDGSIMESDQEHLTLLLFPMKNGSELCHIIEAGSLTGVCPKGLFVVHMFMKQIEDPKADLQNCVDTLFNKNDNNTKPNVLWSLYFSAPNMDVYKNVRRNIFMCPGPDLDLDYDNSVKIAQNIVKDLYPNEEFLPRAPDPEDIIIGEEDDEEKPEESIETNKVSTKADGDKEVKDELASTD